MKPNSLFVNLDKSFWANIRLISEETGYTTRNSGQVKTPSTTEIKQAFINRGLEDTHIFVTQDQLSGFGQLLLNVNSG